jgi:hypothetical protein
MGGVTIGKNSEFNKITGLVDAADTFKEIQSGDYTAGEIVGKVLGAATNTAIRTSPYAMPGTGVELIGMADGDTYNDFINKFSQSGLVNPGEIAGGIIDNLSGAANEKLMKQIEDARKSQEQILANKGPEQIVDTIDIRRRLLAAARKKQGVSSTIYAGTLLGNNPVLGA